MTNNLKKYGKTYFRIGLILKEKNNFNKAISYLLEAYNYIPDNLELTINISEIYRIQEKYKESLGALSKAFKMFPNNYLIFFYAHNIYEEIGDDQTAIEMLKNCLTANPNFLNAYNSLGNILRKIKKFEDAILIYQSGLNIFQNNEVLLNNLANCYLENVILMIR
jgi:protein O-GlcNAc transferase